MPYTVRRAWNDYVPDFATGQPGKRRTHAQRSHSITLTPPTKHMQAPSGQNLHAWSCACQQSSGHGLSGRRPQESRSGTRHPNQGLACGLPQGLLRLLPPNPPTRRLSASKPLVRRAGRHALADRIGADKALAAARWVGALVGRAGQSALDHRARRCKAGGHLGQVQAASECGAQRGGHARVARVWLRLPRRRARVRLRARCMSISSGAMPCTRCCLADTAPRSSAPRSPPPSPPLSAPGSCGASALASCEGPGAATLLLGAPALLLLAACPAPARAP